MTQLRVEDLMTPEPLTVGPSDTLAHVYDLMDAKHIRHLPVVEGDELVGMLSHRDLVSKSFIDVEEIPMSQVRQMMAVQAVSGIMVRGVETVDPREDIRVAAERMFEHKFGCLPVCEGSRLVGILTEADFVRHVAGKEV